MQAQSGAGMAEIRQGHAAYLGMGVETLQPYFPGLLAEAFDKPEILDS